LVRGRFAFGLTCLKVLGERWGQRAVLSRSNPAAVGVHQPPIL